MTKEEIKDVEDFYQRPRIPDDAANLIHPPHDPLTKDPKPPIINTSDETLPVHLQALGYLVVDHILDDVVLKHDKLGDAYVELTQNQEGIESDSENS